VALSSKWFPSGITQDEKDALELSIRNSKFTLDLLSKIIEREIESRSQTKLGDYDQASWAYRRADLDGQVRALKDILTLTKLERTTT